MDIISTIGVSKKLGGLVVNELDSRADEKFEQLKRDQIAKALHEDDQGDSISKFFQLNHSSQFEQMESIDRHYLSTPKRSLVNTLQDPISKRLKRPPTQSPAPPVHDITRRIRRLRLRNHNNSNINTSSVRNTLLTKQKPMEPPSKLPGFSRPTINSMSKNIETATQKTSEERSEKKVVGSGSVFQRLYSTSTISRSNSMGDINAAVNKTPRNGGITMVKSETSRSLRPLWK